MIRRGTRLSRALAVSLVAAPLALGATSFSYWALIRWLDTGEAIARADLARHEADARATHASFYAELGDAWRDYAATEISGLSREETAAEAERAITRRLRQLFERHEGAAVVAEPLVARDQDGARRLGAEARGRLPEAALASFLESLETQPPFLFVDLLELESLARASGASGGLSQVSVRLRVSAYRIAEADQ